MTQQTVLRYESHNGDYEVTVTTDSIDYAWQNFESRIRYRNLLVDEAQQSSPEAYSRYGCSSGDIFLLDSDEALLTDGLHRPVVFETNKYHIKIKLHQVDEDFDPKVIHVNKEVEDTFYVDHESDRREKSLAGTINFVNQPGLFVLNFCYKKAGQMHKEWVAFDVVSPKLDVRHDYKRILDDVNSEFEGLVFDYLSTTFQQLGQGKERNLQVWMQVFEQVVDHYLKYLDRIIQSPYSKMRTTHQYAKADRVKRWQPRMEDEYAEACEAGSLEKHYFEEPVYDNTVNTYENRFVKHTLKHIGGRLAEVFDRLLNAENEVSDNYREAWRTHQYRLKKYMKHPFFKAVGKFEGMRQVGMVLQSRKGYQQVYKDWLKLRKGIAFYEGATNIGTMQIWEIYELWCFLKVKRMVRELMGFDPGKRDSEYDGLISEPQGPLVQEGEKRSTNYSIEFIFPPQELVAEDCPEDRKALLRQHEGERVVLHYQHTYSRSEGDADKIRTLTTEQRPDIVLNIFRGGVMLTYLYDAKYRVWSDKALDRRMEQADLDEMRRIVDEDNSSLDSDQKLQGADYPPSDAINQMHRYRDAIYYSLNGHECPDSKEIIGGYILFPGRGDDKSIAKRYFSRSIDTVNIGAFPLLPIKAEKNAQGQDLEGPQLWAHLENILLKKAQPVAHVKDSIPQRGLRYVSDMDEKGVRQPYLACRLDDANLSELQYGKYSVPLKTDATGRILLNDMSVMQAKRFVFFQMSGGQPQVDAASPYEYVLADAADSVTMVSGSDGGLVLQFRIEPTSATREAHDWEAAIKTHTNDAPEALFFWCEG